MLIEVIFRGLFSNFDFTFFKRMLAGAREVRFNFPEISFTKNYDEILHIVNSNTYIDLVIYTDYLSIEGKIIPRVFINLGRNNDEIEVLLFFDLNDLNVGTVKMNIDYLKKWMGDTQRKYAFQYFVCQIDNADKDEYYFDSNGTGKLYDDLSC